MPGMTCDTPRDIRLVYMTAPDAAHARAIADALVREQLAACVNISAPGHSVYRWPPGPDGTIVSETKCTMIIKTSARALPALRKRALALHPYDQPAFLALTADPDLSDAGFLSWVDGNTVS